MCDFGREGEAVQGPLGDLDILNAVGVSIANQRRTENQCDFRTVFLTSSQTLNQRPRIGNRLSNALLNGLKRLARWINRVDKARSREKSGTATHNVGILHMRLCYRRENVEPASWDDQGASDWSSGPTGWVPEN